MTAWSWGGEEEDEARWQQYRDQAAASATADARERRLILQRMAPDEARHAGPDGGQHHRVTQLGPNVPGRPGCNCGCQGDASPGPGDLAGLLRQRGMDPLTRQEAIRDDVEQRFGRNLDGGEALAVLMRLGLGGVGHEPGWDE